MSDVVADELDVDLELYLRLAAVLVFYTSSWMAVSLIRAYIISAHRRCSSGDSTSASRKDGARQDLGI